MPGNVDDRELQRRVTAIVEAYEESLAAVGQPSLTEGQREVLRAFLVMLYERSRGEPGFEVPKVD